MKFEHQCQRILRPITGRRLSAARRALQRQADAVALFPELQSTETPEQRIARLDADADAHRQQMRDHAAATWRRARRGLRALAPAQQAQVLSQWNHPTWHPPLEAHYLAYLIYTVNQTVIQHKWNTGLPCVWTISSVILDPPLSAG